MVFCGCFSKLSKGNSSSNRIETNDGSPVKTVRINMLTKYAADLSSYSSACNKDSSLKSFDASLHERTNRVFISLAAQANTQSLNQDSLLKVYEFLFELNQDAVRVIIESREDVFKNKDLEPLVDAYFESTRETLDFCSTVDKCVRKAVISQLIIGLAVQQFEKETVETDIGGSKKKKKKYAKTFEELNKFKALGNPFDGEFLTQHELVRNKQVLLLDELRKLRKRLTKKKRNVKILRIVSNVVFVTAFVSVLVLSVVTAAMTGVPMVVPAVASGLAAPIEVAGRWCDKMLKKYEEAVKRQRDVVDSLKREAKANKEETVTIHHEADNLRERIKSIMAYVEIAMEREEQEKAMRDAMQRIKEEVEGLTEKIKEVGDRAAKCSKNIALGRLLVMDHILKGRMMLVKY